MLAGSHFLPLPQSLSPLVSLSLSLLKSSWRQERKKNKAKWVREMFRESERGRDGKTKNKPWVPWSVLRGHWQNNPSLPSHDNQSNDLSLRSSIRGQVGWAWQCLSVRVAPSFVWVRGLERLKDGTPRWLCTFVCLCEVILIWDDICTWTRWVLHLKLTGEQMLQWCWHRLWMGGFKNRNLFISFLLIMIVSWASEKM